MTLKIPPVPSDNLLVNQARAIVTTAWNNGGYRPLSISRIESYYSETSLDSDADPWHIEIGDPDGDYLDTLERNNEVRVKIFGVATRNRSLPVVTGIADEIFYSTDGTLTMTGRDLSSLALDSTVPPQTYRQQRAWAIVQKQARQLGFTDTQLAKSGPEGTMVRKLLQTDGSESYWEFWYRLYRREKLWLWTDPDGTLHGDILNYTSSPLYFFGEKLKSEARSQSRFYIPVERLEITKNTQSRVGEVWVYGQKGNAAIPPAFVSDPTMRHWIRKPRKIMLDSTVRSHREAIKVAWDEIFEGKVGSLELKVTIAEPGFEIQQNSIARLNLPDPGIEGDFFVVGVRRSVGSDGLLQEVRLRERQYAVTRRVPADPKITKTAGTTGDYATTSLSKDLATNIEAPQEWMAYFIKAANQNHGPWDYNLFLAVLLGICHVETNFQNERSNGWTGGSHIIWYPWKGQATSVGGEPKAGTLTDQFGRTKQQWQAAFANENWDGQQDIAVGPMQLLSRNLKEAADDMMKSGYHSQYDGGRWVPEYNIMEGGKYLRDCLKIVAKDSGRDVDIYLGVAAYNQGPGAYTNSAGQAYAASVRRAVTTDPGYLQSVIAARQQSQSDQQTASQQPIVDPGDTTGNNPSSPTGFLNSEQSLATLRAGAGTHLGGLAWGSNTDVKHVNYKLLQNLASLAANTGKTITITSGYRPAGMPGDGPGMAGAYGGAPGGDTQWYLYQRYRQSGFQLRYIAALPPGNHGAGQACDCEINGVPMAKVFSASLMAQFGLHNTVSGDPVHITLTSVTG